MARAGDYPGPNQERAWGSVRVAEAASRGFSGHGPGITAAGPGELKAAVLEAVRNVAREPVQLTPYAPLSADYSGGVRKVSQGGQMPDQFSDPLAAGRLELLEAVVDIARSIKAGLDSGRDLLEAKARRSEAGLERDREMSRAVSLIAVSLNDNLESTNEMLKTWRQVMQEDLELSRDLKSAQTKTLENAMLVKELFTEAMMSGLALKMAEEGILPKKDAKEIISRSLSEIQQKSGRFGVFVPYLGRYFAADFMPDPLPPETFLERTVFLTTAGFEETLTALADNLGIALARDEIFRVSVSKFTREVTGLLAKDACPGCRVETRWFALDENTWRIEWTIERGSRIEERLHLTLRAAPNGLVELRSLTKGRQDAGGDLDEFYTDVVGSIARKTAVETIATPGLRRQQQGRLREGTLERDRET